MRLLLLIFALTSLASAAKVALFILEFSNSQILFNKRVAQTLAEGGHDVTLININPYKGGLRKTIDKDSSIKEFNVDASGNVTQDDMDEMTSHMTFRDFSFFDAKGREAMSFWGKIMGESCEGTIRNQELVPFLKAEKFDVVFTHAYDYCPLGIIHMAGIKSWVWLVSGDLRANIGASVGVPYFSSFIPPGVMDSGNRMTFTQRVKSLIGNTLGFALHPWMIPNPQTALFRKHIRPDFPDLHLDIAPTCPLVMVNTNELYAQATPTLHKVVNIGGLGMQFKDAKALPEEYEKLLSNTKGLFIMSFGSVANSTMMPQSWKESLMTAFGKFPDYQFVMRYTGSDIDGIKPKNVKLTKWIPQADLLKHKKTVGFITHGGYNSYQETILAGKPMIAIPLFGDQLKNARTAEQLGLAIVLNKLTLSAPDHLVEAIQKLIDDKQLAATAEKLSKMAAKKPIKPEELLNKWTTFLAEFKTIDQLVPESVNLNFIQLYQLDVLALLGSVLFIVTYLVYRLTRCVVRCVCCRGAAKQKSE
ncbi:unnamed protein product, partial [Mesorhabditis spiculigera]